MMGVTRLDNIENGHVREQMGVAAVVNKIRVKFDVMGTSLGATSLKLKMSSIGKSGDRQPTSGPCTVA